MLQKVICIVIPCLKASQEFASLLVTCEQVSGWMKLGSKSDCYHDKNYSSELFSNVFFTRQQRYSLQEQLPMWWTEIFFCGSAWWTNFRENYVSQSFYDDHIQVTIWMYFISEHESLQTHCWASFSLFFFKTLLLIFSSLSQRQLCVYNSVFESEAAERTKMEYFWYLSILDLQTRLE